MSAMIVLMMTSCGNKESETNKEEKTSMTFLELAEKRFSVRRFEKTPVEQEKINAILRAAQLAPTAKNLQPQKIYVLKSAEAIKKINEVTSRAYQAPLVFVVCYDKNIAWTNPLDNNESSGEMDATINAGDWRCGADKMVSPNAPGYDEFINDIFAYPTSNRYIIFSRMSTALVISS